MHLVLLSQLRPEALTLTDPLSSSVRSRGKGTRSNSNNRGEEGGNESWDWWCWTQEASLDSSAEMLMDQKASLSLHFSAGSLLLKHSIQPWRFRIV